jgi:hypothetical protein
MLGSNRDMQPSQITISSGRLELPSEGEGHTFESSASHTRPYNDRQQSSNRGGRDAHVSSLSKGSHRSNEDRWLSSREETPHRGRRRGPAADTPPISRWDSVEVTDWAIQHPMAFTKSQVLTNRWDQALSYASAESLAPRSAISSSPSRNTIPPRFRTRQGHLFRPYHR